MAQPWLRFDKCAETACGRYGAPGSTEEWTLQAQYAQYAQYKALFEGFSQHAWEWYSGVIMWKSQSPWPSLRGALYDYFMTQTGG